MNPKNVIILTLVLVADAVIIRDHNHTHKRQNISVYSMFSNILKPLDTYDIITTLYIFTIIQCSHSVNLKIHIPIIIKLSSMISNMVYSKRFRHVIIAKNYTYSTFSKLPFQQRSQTCYNLPI